MPHAVVACGRQHRRRFPLVSTSGAGDPHRQTRTASPVQRHQCSPRSQTSQNVCRRSAASPDRRSAARRRRRVASGRSQSAAVPIAACTPHSSASRICASAALVREPSSSATRRTFGRRHAEVQLHAQHRTAAGDAGVGDDRDSPAARNHSTDGISATSSRPAASESASRLGKSNSNSRLRRKLLPIRTPAACCSDS